MIPTQPADAALTNSGAEQSDPVSCGQVFVYLQTKSLQFKEFKIIVSNGSLRVLQRQNNKIKMELETRKFHATKALKTYASFEKL